MHYLGTVLVVVAWSLVCAWAGMKWGNKEAAKLREEITDLRSRLASRIGGAVGAPPQASKVNPYKA